MFQTRLILKNPSMEALKIIADPYKMHQAVFSVFQDDPIALFRVSPLPDLSGYQVLMMTQSPLPSAEQRFCKLLGTAVEVETRPAESNFQAGALYWFDLEANPTRRDAASRKRIGITQTEEQIDWLRRKLEGAADLEFCNVTASHPVRFPKKEATITLWIARYQGALRVRDPHRLSELLQRGVGTAKGMGYGLLTLTPIQ